MKLWIGDKNRRRENSNIAARHKLRLVSSFRVAYAPQNLLVVFKKMPPKFQYFQYNDILVKQKEKRRCTQETTQKKGWNLAKVGGTTSVCLSRTDFSEILTTPVSFFGFIVRLLL